MSILMKLTNINMVFSKRVGFSKKHYHVLRDINLDIEQGKIIALVGESGCGKTTLGKIITGLLKPTTGKVTLDAMKKDGKKTKDDISYEGTQFIQQDSYAALNPVKTIYQSLYAPIKNYNKHLNKTQIDKEIDHLMSIVGLTPPQQFLTKYPHQLSGGQRQRILMARALSLKPKLIVADEPVSMIDVSLRLSILNLMNNLNKEFGISFIYITHDLSTARYIAKGGDICVMYLGEIVERGPAHDIINKPFHPYTKALVKAVPIPDPTIKYDELPIKSYDLTSLDVERNGCPFSPRCLYASEACNSDVPYYEKEGRIVKCVIKEGDTNDE